MFLGATATPASLQDLLAPLSPKSQSSAQGKETKPTFALPMHSMAALDVDTPFLTMMNAFLPGCSWPPHGSRDTCKSPLRTRIYMTSTQITKHRISPALQRPAKGDCPFPAPVPLILGEGGQLIALAPPWCALQPG
jgi:hypothetical protein